MKGKRWYDYLWVATALYLVLGFFNILFAWLAVLFLISLLRLPIFSPQVTDSVFSRSLPF